MGIWIVLALIVVVNLYGLWIMGYDKKQAKHKSRRVPEKRLFAIAFLGGGLGTYWGMMKYRHKTQHLSFKLLFPLAALWCLVLYWAVFRVVGMIVA
ncbi:MAG: DUF1294 domain-containing protein [Tumebacillaceae bacterium]